LHCNVHAVEYDTPIGGRPSGTGIFCNVIGLGPISLPSPDKHPQRVQHEVSVVKGHIVLALGLKHVVCHVVRMLCLLICHVMGMHCHARSTIKCACRAMIHEVRWIWGSSMKAAIGGKGWGPGRRLRVQHEAPYQYCLCNCVRLLLQPRAVCCFWPCVHVPALNHLRHRTRTLFPRNVQKVPEPSNWISYRSN